MSDKAGLVAGRVRGLLPTLEVDVRVLGGVEEPVMLFPTPILLAGLERLTSSCGWAIIGFVIILPVQAQGTSFHLFFSIKAALSSAPASLKALQEDSLVDPAPGRYS